MKEGTHQATVGASSQHLRSALVVVEVAMAVVLVIGAVLEMVQSLRALNRIASASSRRACSPCS